MRPSQLTTLNHATPRSPQPLQSRSHLGPGERPQPTKRGGGNNRCESAWTEQRRRHHCQAGNAHCHNKCHTYWNAQKSDKWILPRILHRTGVSINHYVAISKARKNSSFQAYFIKKKLPFLGLFYKKKLGSDKLGLVTDSKGRKYLWQPLIFYL